MLSNFRSSSGALTPVPRNKFQPKKVPKKNTEKYKRTEKYQTKFLNLKYPKNNPKINPN